MNNYIPLYRKYRPQSFADLIGQESVVKTLSNALNYGRISHAYLFTGPRGTGKTSSARILAKSLNCVEGPTITPCGKCPSCVDIANANSIDVIEIDAASNRKVEDARNLLEKVHFVPVSGKYKVYIIDEVHMLTTEAFNTLLKTLEEPPKNLVFILATTEAHKVLNTIISRCQRFDFRRVPQELIIQSLKNIAEKENIKINEKALSLIAKKAYGGMRDALGLLDQASVLANQDVEITENDILTLFGSLSEDSLYELANCIAQRDTLTLIETADRAVQSCEPVNVIRELVNYFRSLLIIKTSPDIEQIRMLINLTDSIIPGVKAQSEHFETDEIIQIIEKLCEYEKTIKTTHQQQLWLEMSLLSVCHRQDMRIIKDLEQRVSRLESGMPPIVKNPEVKIAMVAAPAAPVPSTPPDSPAPPPPTTPAPPPIPQAPPATVVEEEPVELTTASYTQKPDNTVDEWSRLLSIIKSIDIPLEAQLRTFFNAVKINPEEIIIISKSDMWATRVEKDKKGIIEQAGKILFDTQPKITIRIQLQGDIIIEEKKNPEPEKPRIEPPAPKPASQIAIDVEERISIDIEVQEEIKEMHKPVAPVDISDQGKMILEIFNGKVIE